eukprot:TRINITY_DN27131_c0_g2_i1.p1 TRINITY_DN27131_c0_g2~~TRINITY_DN27131_c0_g2_i1.p1  ORF type:complete len:476 (+),score=66.51 TRINITY_DN27131_c0_g2_i1:27-1430(+)
MTKNSDGAMLSAAVEEPGGPPLSLDHAVHKKDCAVDEVWLTAEEEAACLRLLRRSAPKCFPCLVYTSETRVTACPVDLADIGFLQDPHSRIWPEASSERPGPLVDGIAGQPLPLEREPSSEECSNQPASSCADIADEVSSKVTVSICDISEAAAKLPESLGMKMQALGQFSEITSMDSETKRSLSKARPSKDRDTKQSPSKARPNKNKKTTRSPFEARLNKDAEPKRSESKARPSKDMESTGSASPARLSKDSESKRSAFQARQSKDTESKRSRSQARPSKDVESKPSPSKARPGKDKEAKRSASKARPGKDRETKLSPSKARKPGLSHRERKRLISGLEDLLADPLTLKWFGKPVDLCKYKEYLEKIAPNKPMDLGTVLANLKDEKYDSSSNCLGDLRLVWQNAKTFTSRNSAAYKQAAEIEHKVEMFFNSLEGAGAEKSPQGGGHVQAVKCQRDSRSRSRSRARA